jgi:hypothetical protein
MADVDLVIYDSKIIAMSLPGGQTWRWARQRRARVERLAKMNVRSRSGELSRSIHGYYEPAPPNQVIMEVHAEAPHALWVHEGTDGPITSESGARMYLPPYGPWSGRRVHQVRGQQANPFLADALEEVMLDL